MNAEQHIARFRKAHAFNQTRFDDYKELMAFFEGEQHLLSSYSGEKPWVVDITTPYATDAIMIRVSSLMSNDYIGEIEPLSPDDVDAIHELNMAYQNHWRAMNMDNIISESILRAAVLREAYALIYYNKKLIKGGKNRKNKGELRASLITPESVVIDPNALSLKDADYVYIIERISKQKAKDKYKINPDEIKPIFSTYERGEVYEGNDYDFEQEPYTKITCYEVENRDTDEQTIYHTVLIENQIVEPREKMDLRFLPLAQLRWEKRMKSAYGISLMDRVLPLQKSVNSIESAITNTALQFAAPSFIVSKDSGLDPDDVALSAGSPGVVYPVEGDINNAIKPMFEGRVVDEQMVIIKKENEASIYKMAGVSDQFLGELGTAGNTTGGSNAAIQRAKIVEQQFLANLEEFVEDLTNIIVDFEVTVFGGQNIYIRGEKQANGDFAFMSAAIPEEKPDYTFAVDLEVKTPYSKERTKQLVQELWQMERQYDSPLKVINVKDILKTFNVPNREELVRRYDDMAIKNDETKSQIIMEITRTCIQYGLPDEMLQQAIKEILAGKETPTVDQIMMQVEQMIKQQEQLAQQQQAEQQALAQKQQMQQDQLAAQNTMQQVEMETEEMGEQPEQMGGEQGGMEQEQLGQIMQMLGGTQ